MCACFRHLGPVSGRAPTLRSAATRRQSIRLRWARVIEGFSQPPSSSLSRSTYNTLYRYIARIFCSYFYPTLVVISFSQKPDPNTLRSQIMSSHEETQKKSAGGKVKRRRIGRACDMCRLKKSEPTSAQASPLDTDIA